MTRLGAALILLCSLVTGTANAALTLPEVLDKMDHAQLQLNDASAEFEETIRQGGLPEQTITGEAQLKKPNYLRLQQNEPHGQRLISDGKTFWLYTPGQKQQISGDWSAWVKQSNFPLPLIDFVGTQSATWRKYYKVYFGGYDDKLYKLRFKPVAKQALPVTLWVSEETFLPVRGEMAGENLNVKVTLKNVKSNPGVDEALFAPRVPEGTAEVSVTF